MSPWGWQPERQLGLWRHGACWMRPFVAAAPFLTVLLLLLMMHFVAGTVTSAKGVLFDLPDASQDDSEPTGQVALVMPMAHDTLVFFDDSRYLLSDPASARSLAEHLAESIGRSEVKTLLVLADRRVAGGELMNLAAMARRGGAGKILFAEKKGEAAE